VSVPANSSPASVVLVVDDDPQVRKLFTRVLLDAGHPVLLAADGSEAVEVYRVHAGIIGLVLLDVEVPARDGPATLAELRRIDPSVRCCFVSADAGGVSREELLAQGAAAFVKKPVSVADLTKLVDRLTRGADARDATE
jgi:CheY-like chemotaxis protein